MDSARWRLNSMKPLGVDITVVPPVSAIEQSLCRSAWQAMCSATSEDEHGVDRDGRSLQAQGVGDAAGKRMAPEAPMDIWPSSPSGSSVRPRA
ncbi:hypothetical protein SANTM175S_08606 [Streptomyces antimycoticus]